MPRSDSEDVARLLRSSGKSDKSGKSGKVEVGEVCRGAAVKDVEEVKDHCEPQAKQYRFSVYWIASSLRSSQ